MSAWNNPPPRGQGVRGRNIGMTNESSTCLWCGSKLKPWIEDEPERGLGYFGDDVFCTLRCGWQFGLWFAVRDYRIEVAPDDD